MSYTFDRARIRAAIVEGARAGVTGIAVDLQTGLRTILDTDYGGALDADSRKWSRSARYRTKRRKKDGTFAMRKRKSRGYRRSRPGEPPAKQTGALLNSWQTALRRPKSLGGAVTLRVTQDGLRVPYAAALEYGYAPNNLAPRPYLAPSVEASQEKAVGIMQGAISAALVRNGMSGGEAIAR